MEISRASHRSKRVKFFTIVLILGSLYLSGCGQHSRLHGALNANGAPTGQASFNDVGDQVTPRPYLALTPPDEADLIKNSIVENDANKEFASQIVAASINRVGIGAEVQIQTTTTSLIFKGDLSALNSTFIGNFPEGSGQHPDLVLYVSCSDQACNHADLFLSDQQGHKAAIVVSTEDRILHTTIPDGETEDQIKTAGLAKFAQDTKVHYNLTEIFPGKSTYTVTTIEADPKNSKMLFSGDIQNTEDGLVHAESSVVDKTQTASLAGVDPDNMVFEVETTPDPKKPEETKTIIYNVRTQEGVTVRPGATKNPTSSANVPEKCKVQLKGEVNPMVNDILKQCTQPRVTDAINSWWKRDNKGGFTQFMKLYEASKTAQDHRAHDFKLMVDVLHSYNFPTVWSWVTAVESSFYWRARPHPPQKDSGELGVWQITTATRNANHISDEEALQIVPATTKAISKLYQPLINNLHGNIPMILAGYNMGGPNVNKGMAILMQLHLKSDFWELCKMNLNVSTCTYVSRIISGMITSLDPAAYGMTNITPMEAK